MTETPPENPTPTPPADPPTPTPADADTAWSKLFAGQTPEQVKAALEQSRKWEGRAKENFTAKEQLEALTKLLTGDGQAAPDPAKLASELTAAQRQANATRVENAVLMAAITNGADPIRLTDSRSFMAQVSNLDPDDSDFQAKVGAAVKAAAESPTFQKPGPQPTRQQGRVSEGTNLAGRAAGLAEAQKRFPEKFKQSQ